MLPDFLNATFEAVGGIMILANCLATLHDKRVAGVRWWPVAFFAVWGLWNLYYYPHLSQWLSFSAGIFIVLANIMWVGLLIYYGRRSRKDG